MERVAPLGPVYQAGTLSGNPLAMVAGLVTLQEWRKPGVFEQATQVALDLVNALQKCADQCSIPLSCARVGTMFGFFFTSSPVRSYKDTQRSDTTMFRRFFHAMLERGVYFAPSAFEAGFVSVAHAGEALEYTVEALSDTFKLLR
jgi:glutamate-1-semialdehyde 2,1-aminomutase